MSKLKAVVSDNNNVVIMDENDTLVGVVYTGWSNELKRFLITKHVDAYSINKDEVEQILRRIEPLPEVTRN